MQFDGTITLGALLMTITMIGGFMSTIVALTVAFTKLGGRLDLLAHRVFGVEQKVEGISTMPTRLAVLETTQSAHGKMISVIQSDITGLRKGEGWITSGRNSVEGEYEKA